LVIMMTHRTMISRQLRSARTSTLTTEERREELRVAELAAARKDGRHALRRGAHDRAKSRAVGIR
jgi:hypothetical protein